MKVNELIEKLSHIEEHLEVCIEDTSNGDDHIMDIVITKAISPAIKYVSLRSYKEKVKPSD